MARVNFVGTRPLLLLLSLASACGGGDSNGKTRESDSSLAQKYEAKLRQCGVIGAGEFHLATELDDEFRCVIERCYLPAGCEALKAAICEWGGIENGGPPEADPVVMCAFRCEEDTRFECANGDTIEAASVCNGSDTCQDGQASDEADCEGKLWACGDGEHTSTRDLCDGIEHCENGADEADCPSFRCNSGEDVPAVQQCDGEPQCPDASDEAGCARSCG